MSIKTWKERWRNPWLYKRDAMQAEIDELRAEITRLTGIAFLASAERDELRMELGDLPEAQADMLATIKAQRKVLQQVLNTLIDVTASINMKRFWRDKDGKRFDEITDTAITAIQGVLK